MKIIGALLFSAAAGAFGIYLAGGLILRQKKLEQAISYIESIYEEMRLSNAELPAILSRLDGDIYIKNGVWQGTEGLKSEDIALLESFLKKLGKSDLKGQEKNAALHTEALKGNLKTACEKRKEYGKLYISLSFLGGLFIAILLI